MSKVGWKFPTQTRKQKEGRLSPEEGEGEGGEEDRRESNGMLERRHSCDTESTNEESGSSQVLSCLQLSLIIYPYLSSSSSKGMFSAKCPRGNTRKYKGWKYQGHDSSQNENSSKWGEDMK